MHDFENYRYISKKGKKILLTKRENKILKLLIDNQGEIVTKDEICKAVYGEPLDYLYEECIYILIYRLRKKLKGEITIKTRVDIGYYVE